MTLQAVPGGLFLPHTQQLTAGPAVFVAVVQDAAADRAAVVFRVPKTGNIDRVVIGIGAITTAAALDVRLETVNTANNNPSGTLWGTNTSATTGTPSANTQIEVTLTAVAAVTIGQMIAVVVQPNTTPINLNINHLSSTSMGGGQLPYGIQNVTGAYAGSNNIPCYGVRYSTGEWAFLGASLVPILSLNTTAFNSGTGATTGTRRGLLFQIPFPATLAGCRVKFSGPTTADGSIALYDNSGTLLQTLATIDGSQQQSVSTAGAWFIPFDAPYDLAKNTNYRLTVEATTANSITMHEYAVGAAGYMGAMPGGTNFQLTKFVSSAWVDVATERVWLDLWLTAFDDGGPTDQQVADAVWAYANRTLTA